MDTSLVQIYLEEGIGTELVHLSEMLGWDETDIWFAMFEVCVQSCKKFREENMG